MSIIRKFAAVALSLTTAFCALPALSAPVQAATLPPLIHIDTPAPNAAVSQSGSSVPITISGWAVSAAKITSVTATFDGHAATGAALNLSRPDVAKKYPAYPYAKTSGFKANMLVVPSIAEGFHTITVTAKTADGKTFSATVKVQYHKPAGFRFPGFLPEFTNTIIDTDSTKGYAEMGGNIYDYYISHAQIKKIVYGDPRILRWTATKIYAYATVSMSECVVDASVTCKPTGQVSHYYFDLGF